MQAAHLEASQALDCAGVDADTLEVLNRVLRSSNCGSMTGEISLIHEGKSLSSAASVPFLLCC